MENLCMSCMQRTESIDEVCPYCGESLNEPQASPFLPKKTQIGQRYIVGKGLEIDGEGLSYIGYDNVKKSKIYIREFYPSNFCARQSDFTKIRILADSEKMYKGLLIEFLKYFRSVARLRNLPAITAVYDIFEENNTAYIIMEWVEGTRLDKYLGLKGGYLSWSEAQILFMPLLSSLSHVASSRVFHLGICPANMMVTPENKIKLIGFATKSLRSKNSLINDQLYTGCSALEQYLGDYPPSESTDVYGFAASLFWALTGEYPLASTDRRQNDKLMMPQPILKRLPENVITAIANALRVYPNNRTISFETLRLELSNSPVIQVKNIENSPQKFAYKTPVPEKNKSAGIIWGVISCITALLVLVACLGIYWFWLKDNTSPQQSETQTSQENEYQNNETLQEQPEKDEEKIPVPELIGRNFKNLQEELLKNSASKYRIVLLSEEFHNSIGEGCIISQTPNYGEEMTIGSTIAVNVSKGNQKRTLPDIEGKSLSEASQLLTNEKLIPVQASNYSIDVPEGTVMGYKDYKAGNIVDYGSEVVIVVSKGPQ